MGRGKSWPKGKEREYRTINDTLGHTVWSRSDGDPTGTRVGVEGVLPTRGERAECRQEVLPDNPVGFAEPRARERAVVLVHRAVWSPSAGLWPLRTISGEHILHISLRGGFKIRGQADLRRGRAMKWCTAWSGPDGELHEATGWRPPHRG